MVRSDPINSSESHLFCRCATHNKMRVEQLASSFSSHVSAPFIPYDLLVNVLIDNRHNPFRLFD